MDFKQYQELWAFISEYLPNYYRRNDVLRSDILMRYYCGENVNEMDRDWIKKEFGNDRSLIRQENLRLEIKFVSEALQFFYEQLDTYYEQLDTYIDN